MLDRVEATLPATPLALPGTPPLEPDVPELSGPSYVCYSERAVSEAAPTLREERMSAEQWQRWLDLACKDPDDAPLCDDDPEPPLGRSSTDTRPWPQGQGPTVFCLICEDRGKQVLRDCCPGCKLQDVTVPLDDPVAIEALALDRDRSSK